ncbi:MAG: outer membrane protein OmpA-like peptidoglycan-associated protein [Bacteriovoracaceae bacterium]|jgi:outer membrane protein OmpA-like peptidoglycan-associated protein
MRAKKNREVNIFSASVVDLFASGLGVFLIVSIIALVNQKKENSKAKEGSQNNPVMAEMAGEIELLTAKLDKLTDENFQLKVKSLKNKKVDDTSKIEISQNLEIEVLKSNLIRTKQDYNKRLEAMQVKVEESKQMIDDLNKAVSSERRSAALGKKGVGTNFKEFEVGSKILLQDVHFYPGTDRAIEPYASRELTSFAVFMSKNPNVTVEISGHIFETQKAIESGKAEDEYNLSGRRARNVCNILIREGVNPKRLRCVGYGASRPIEMTNDQYSETAQKNRRVEVEILTK